MPGPNNWLKVRCVRENDFWIVLLGTELALLDGTKKLEPCIQLATGPDRDSALYNALWKLRDLARFMDFGVVP